MLALWVAPAAAQDAPLTTLLRPPPLTTPTPLARPGVPLGGERPLTGENPVPNRPRDARAGPGPATPDGAPGECSAGPGAEYAPFLGGDPSAKPTGNGDGPRTPARDQPLYGGTDRPLWDTTRPSPPRPTKPGTAAVRADAPVPRPGVDRPLWPTGESATPTRCGEARPGEPARGAPSAFGTTPAR